MSEETQTSISFSETKTINYGYRWKIPVENSEFYSEAIFPSNVGEDGLQWKLSLDRLIPIMDIDDEQDHSVSIVCTRRGRTHLDKRMVIGCRLFVLDVCGKEFDRVTTEFLVSPNAEPQGNICCDLRLEFSSAKVERSNVFTSDGSFTVCCDVVVQLWSNDGATTNQTTIATDIRKLLFDPTSSDIMIKVIGKSRTCEFPAHRLILAARSDVFSAMFSHDTQEKQTSCLKIEDAEPEAIREFLWFLYTDQVPNIKQWAYQLITLADKYAIAKLKGLAGQELVQNMNVDNVLSTLVTFHLQSNVEFKKVVVDYVIEHFKEIYKQEEWMTIQKTHLDLVNEIMLASTNKSKKRKRSNVE